MSSNLRFWIKPGITLLSLGILTLLAPIAPLDPWNLLSPKKIATMILALAVIQAFGSVAAHYLGVRTGALLTGFLGGLISSTATTASLARRSKNSTDQKSGEVLIFLSATGAMLFEGLVLVISGTTVVNFSHLIIFIGPIFATAAMIFIQYRKQLNQNNRPETSVFQILPIIKLSFFIAVILSISKIFQNMFGPNGLLVLTSLVSLFEIHGSVIANVQLHDSGGVTSNFLCTLLAISIIASYVSKLFLISTLGSRTLKVQVTKSTLFLFGSLAISWLIAMNM